LENLRADYFEIIPTKYFDFAIAKSLKVDSVKSIIRRDTDNFIDSLCSFLETDTHDLQRIKTYIYANKEDLQQFIAASPQSTVYGKSIGNITHLSNFDITLFRHETSHTIIGQKVGLNPNIFFLEGFAVCTGYYFDAEAYQHDLEGVKAHPELLTIGLINSANDFYNSMQNYPIAGAFTKYLIDRIGMSEFKQAYATDKIQENLRDITGDNLEQLIGEFNEALLPIHEKQIIKQ